MDGLQEICELLKIVCRILELFGFFWKENLFFSSDFRELVSPNTQVSLFKIIRIVGLADADTLDFLSLNLSPGAMS